MKGKSKTVSINHSSIFNDQLLIDRLIDCNRFRPIVAALLSVWCLAAGPAFQIVLGEFERNVSMGQFLGWRNFVRTDFICYLPLLLFCALTVETTSVSPTVSTRSTTKVSSAPTTTSGSGGPCTNIFFLLCGSGNGVALIFATINTCNYRPTLIVISLLFVATNCGGSRN